MKRLATGFVFIFTVIVCHPQLNADSLLRVMHGNAAYEDRIKAYLRFIHEYSLRDFDSTIQAANEALLLARQNGDSVTVAELKSAIGVSYYFKGSYDIAAENYYQSISLLEKIQERTRLANAYNDLAKLYRKIRDLDKALENYNKAESIFRSLNDTAGILMILNESGVVFEYREDYNEALRRYSASRDLAEKINDRLGISYALSNIAGVYAIQKKYEEAEKNLLRALAIRNSLGDSFAVALTYSDLGATMNAKGDYEKAIAYLTESNRMAEKIHYAELQANNYNELASAASRQSDYKKALEYFQKRTALRDSIFSTDKTRQVEELNAKYETVKKQQIIEQQHNRLIWQNTLFWGIAGLVLLLGLLGWSQYKRYRLAKETQLKNAIMKQQELATRAVIEAEEEERQRIARDLHDGVGQMMSAAKMNLSAFESELVFRTAEQKDSFENIIRLVDDSCQEVRSVSHNMMPNVLLKSNLDSAIRDFIEKLDKKTLTVHVFTEGLGERLDSNTETVLYRIIQEGVNNVIKHANATELDISIIRDKDGVSASIEDNGRGFDINDRQKSGGVGLKNISTRVEYLKGTVEIDSAAGRGTVISLNIPLG